VRLGVQRVVGTLAELGADRVDRRQVDDVEAHLGDGREPLHRTSERSRLGCAPAHRVVRRALRAREQLVPGAEEGAFAVDDERVPVGGRHVLAQRMALEQLVDLRRVGRLEPHDRGDGVLAQCADHALEERAVALGHALGRALEDPRALLQHQLGVLAARDLDAGVVPPVRDRVAPGLDPEVPHAGGGGSDLGGVPVGAADDLAHARERPGLPLRVAQDHTGAEHLVPLAEHGGADLEGLAGDGLGRPATAVDHRLDVEYGNTSDHRWRAYRRRSGINLVFRRK
jgi:hypothetical protein